MFTDECSFERGSGQRAEWTWCYKYLRLDQRHVKTYYKGQDISMVLWGRMQRICRSDIVVMEHDDESLPRGYTA